MGPKIHFAALVCVDYELDIAEKWCEHYEAFGFDTYTVFLQSTDRANHKRNCAEAAPLFWEHGFQVRDIDEDWNEGRLRCRAMEPFHDSLPPEDYIVVADSDEFHNPTLPLPRGEGRGEGYRDLILSCDIVQGRLIDRWGSRLENVRQDMSLDKQYPNRGYFFEDSGVKLAVDYDIARNKIMACRCDIRPVYIGSHVTEDISRPHLISCGHPVEHFTYRKRMLPMMSFKFYFSSETMLQVAKHFGEDITHPAIQAKMQEENELLRGQGWVPANRTDPKAFERAQEILNHDHEVAPLHAR